MNKTKEINKFIEIEACYINDKFIGLRLDSTKLRGTDESCQTIIISIHDSRFRCGDRFVPNIGDKVIYKKLNLLIGNEPDLVWDEKTHLEWVFNKKSN